MRVLILTPIFLPDEYPIAHLVSDVAWGLAEMGDDVQIVTGNKNLKVSECTLHRANPDVSMRIFRLPFVANGTGGLFKKAFNYFKFARVAYKYRGEYTVPDIIYTVVPSNENGWAAKKLAKYYSCHYVINVQDIHPDAIFSLGLIKNSLFKAALILHEKLMYQSASGVTVIGSSFKTNLLRKGVVPQIRIIPNWVDMDDYDCEDEEVVKFKRDHGISDRQFVVLYSGTFGRIHGTEVIVNAAKLLEGQKDIIFLLVGHGIGFTNVLECVTSLALANVITLPPVPRSMLGVLQAVSDISVVTLLPSLGYSSIPSKVLGYMAAGRPIVALADPDCDTAKLIEGAKCGYILPPGDPARFAEFLREVSHNVAELRLRGINGKKYVGAEFQKNKLIQDISEFLDEIISKNNPSAGE